MFDIDWQGTRQVVETLHDDVVSVFLLPPTMAELKARLERRAEDPPEVIARALRNAREEIAQWANYDYVLVNRTSVTPSRLEGDRRRRASAPRAPISLAPLVDELLGTPI
jgi:guanylate kinase